ncbi:sulfatase [Paraferrimonas sp. SM1919]|uniref:sulfatase family protein n=1 Tax=Paraferrimonas sp. SM1919 TaxID=2662263 RepID=UPI0013D6CB49|nr:sulfatase [Paraferrimonas sp. SM1919]
MKKIALITFISSVGLWGCNEAVKEENVSAQVKRPNILILMSDNHSDIHLGTYGDKVVKTPNIDKIAAQGIKFNNAFGEQPSCSPARAAMLTGQNSWRLGDAANLWGSFPKVPVYPELLKQAGYHVGIEGKGWGPGKAEVTGWEHNPGGERYGSFEEFYNEIDKGAPWMYWYSSRDPHRPFKREGWKKANVDLAAIEVPSYLPDTEDVRKDIGDYYYEIQSFDREVESYLSLVGEMGQLDNTIVIITSDNGWQFPRGLANLYDAGTKVPLIVYYPKGYKGGRVIDDFVTLNDLAPTFLELAGIEIPQQMTAKSLVNILQSDASGQIEPERDFAVTARERHAYVRQDGKGYPGRAIRTKDYLLIKNYTPEAWPAGQPPLFGDVDAHMLQYPSPTKMEMLVNREDPAIKPLFELSFGKRPMYELYDVKNDPDQINNLAADPAFANVKQELEAKLVAYLQQTGDPRETEAVFDWDASAYYMEKDKRPRPSQEAIEALGLEEEYSYVD